MICGLWLYHIIHDHIQSSTSRWTATKIVIIQDITLNFVGPTSWKTKTSPSSNLCAAENCLHPALNPVLCAIYFTWKCLPASSSKVIVLSLAGKYDLQNAPGSPCYFIKIKNIYNASATSYFIKYTSQLKIMYSSEAYHPK